MTTKIVQITLFFIISDSKIDLDTYIVYNGDFRLGSIAIIRFHKKNIHTIYYSLSYIILPVPYYGIPTDSMIPFFPLRVGLGVRSRPDELPRDGKDPKTYISILFQIIYNIGLLFPRLTKGIGTV